MALSLYKWLAVTGIWLLQSHTGTVSPGSGPGAGERSAPGAGHPFYIAVTEISQNEREHTLEITCKLFAEDLEEVLRKLYKSPVDLGSEKDKAALDKMVATYFDKHLVLSGDSRPLKLAFIGYEKDKESMFCYLQVDNVSTLKRLDVENSILHDYIDKQTNIVHAVVGGKRHSTKLDFPATQATFSF